MIHFDLPKEKSSILKVIGVGGGGNNAVNYMYSQQIEGVNFVICNTDAQALAGSSVPNRIQLGPHLTQGLGAGANPEIGRQATEESLEEIKRILEVNTKMVFITAGMGGGTGTGGAPIIANICKDLGILTVGIVTTPFAYEGKKRQQQALDGIRKLEKYVDTLLVISNDKLRHQYGNLKMRDAFAKADNVLATAAKCITDVINSTGQINVDFADVCTVMRNGGVAILGHAEASGENRAERAMEEALNSPLLNDSDIRGAKWILINITSASGEHEFTMDEVEIIQNYLLTQAGENTDVILGMGYDTNLGDKIGITLIATGFEQKDPFAEAKPKKEEPRREEKIIMILGQEDDAVKPAAKEETENPKAAEREMQVMEEELMTGYPAPQLVFETERPAETAPVIDFSDLQQPVDAVLYFEREEAAPEKNQPLPVIDPQTQADFKMKVVWKEQLDEESQSAPDEETERPVQHQVPEETVHELPTGNSGGYLTKPVHIYATEPELESVPQTDNEEQLPADENKEADALIDLQMQLIERDDVSVCEPKETVRSANGLFPEKDDCANNGISPMEEEGEQQRRAAERLNKLRNLSFNINASDPNNEFETVPAYIRRNMELHTGISKIEDFYSNYEVKADDKNKSQISSINTFLDGKKPD